ncbi:MAG TPA: putative metal-binding motif-containing protein, partial [Myxococcota bacterium]|nr:putative metal-binding motif-containing protein [Myxococcota bacterium]
MLLSLVLHMSVAEARTYHVPEDFGTLAEAVNQATNNDIIVLAPGFHVVSSSIRLSGSNKVLTIAGTAPPEEIDDPDEDINSYIEPDWFNWGGGDQVFEVTNGARIQFRNLYIKARELACGDKLDNDGDGNVDKKDPDCLVPGDTGDTAGGSAPPPVPSLLRAFTISGGANVTLDYVHVQGWDYVSVAPTVFAADSDLVVTNSLFSFNSAPWTHTPVGDWELGFGGALYLEDMRAQVDHTTFMYNDGKKGGAIYARRNDAAPGVLTNTLLVDNSVFAGNFAHDGGAIFAEGVSVNLRHTHWYGNTATAVPPLTGERDRWPYEGGALYLEDGAVDLWNNVFYNNQTFDFGAAVMVRRRLPNASLPQIYFNTFVNNSAPDSGGVMWFEEVEFTLNSNIIAFNGTVPIVGFQWPVVSPPDVQYNDFYANLIVGGTPNSTAFGGDLVIYPLSVITNISADPLFVQVPAEVDHNEYRFFRFWPSVYSPVVNTGDPSFQDPDLTRADMGAYGGVDAPTQDADGDGWSNIYDCDDSDPTIFPFNVEPCDDLDNNCNGLIDDYETSWYVDADLDGHGDPNSVPFDACPGEDLPDLVGGAIWVGNSDDCDDTNPRRYANLTEICDGIDNDCDFAIDEEIPTRAFWPDRDFDGFGHGFPGDEIVIACPPQQGDFWWSPFNTDCDDRDPDIHPLISPEARLHAPLASHELEFSEADRDAAFVADRLDEDCDGYDLCYSDFDGDGYGAEALPGQPPEYKVDNDLICENLSALTSETANDCDDRDAGSYPGATEVTADGLDQNCDGKDQCYEDLDDDGFGSANTIVDNDLDCDNGNARSSSQTGDCDDRPDVGANANPEEEEVCDGLDNNCDGVIDELASPDAQEYFLDADGDGWGTVYVRIKACGQPVGYVDRPGDCDDNQQLANPEEIERCDGIDNNCLNGIDEVSAIDVVRYYEDR